MRIPRLYIFLQSTTAIIHFRALLPPYNPTREAFRPAYTPDGPIYGRTDLHLRVVARDTCVSKNWPKRGPKRPPQKVQYQAKVCGNHESLSTMSPTSDSSGPEAVLGHPGKRPFLGQNESFFGATWHFDNFGSIHRRPGYNPFLPKIRFHLMMSLYSLSREDNFVILM